MTDDEKSALIQEIAEALWALEAVTGPISAIKKLHLLLAKALDAYVAENAGVVKPAGGGPK